MKLRLHGRIVALLIGLVLAAQLATFAVVHLATDRSVRAQLSQELAVGERVWRRFHEARGEQLLETAMVLADDFGLKAAVASGEGAVHGRDRGPAEAGVRRRGDHAAVFLSGARRGPLSAHSQRA